MNLSIRNYKSTDCEPLYSLFYDTVHAVAEYTDIQLDAWADGRPDLDEWHRSFVLHKTFVAEADGVIVGFGDIDVSVECSICATAFLDRLYVHKDFQRKGIGRTILKELEKYASDNAAGVIRTYSSITALPFFEAMGYENIRENTVIQNGVELTNYLIRKEV